MALMISHFLEETRRVYSAANYLRSNSSATINDLSLFEISIPNLVQVSSDSLQNSVLNILQAQSSIEQSIFTLKYFYDSYPFKKR